MTTAYTKYLKDKDSNIILPATDYSAIQNLPSLALTSELPTLGSFTTTGITFENGGYTWSGTSSGGSDDHNCAYRVADFQTFKLVELRMVFSCTSSLSAQTNLIKLPSSIVPDWDLQSWHATDESNCQVWFHGDGVGLAPKSGATSTANHMYSFTFTYFTTA